MIIKNKEISVEDAIKFANHEEILFKNLPNMEKEIVNHVQEAQRVPGRINPRRNTLRHTVIKLTKIRDKILKATREKR